MIAGAAFSLGSIVDRILALHGWVALAIVFALPALEASAFVGFIFPGEIAVLLGGVLAYEGRIPLAGAIAAAVLGAILGDTIGYFVGRRYGRTILRHTVGRVIKKRHRDLAEDYLRQKGGRAVFLGRFTTALRVLVPGLAGMSRMPYRRFFAFNAAGGALWGAGFVLLGYVGGASYHRVERIASRLGFVLLGAIVLGLALGRAIRAMRERSDRLRALGDRLAGSRPLAWFRRQFPSRVAWLRRRMEPGAPTGFPLTFTLAAFALAAWAFGGLTQDVIGHDDAVLLDPRVESWVVAHRTEWATALMKVATWLGSTAVLYPALVLVGGLFLVRRRDWRPGAKLGAALVGAVALYSVAKLAVGRIRPPASLWIGHYSGWAFPSGHATQAIAFYGMLALILSPTRSARLRALIWGAATVITLLIGVSRVYLGAHWLVDILGGYALGAGWLAIVVAATLLGVDWKGGRKGTAGKGESRKAATTPAPEEAA